MRYLFCSLFVLCFLGAGALAQEDSGATAIRCAPAALNCPIIIEDDARVCLAESEVHWRWVYLGSGMWWYLGVTHVCPVAENAVPGHLPQPVPAVNECLNLSLDELVGMTGYQPQSNTFYVDNVAYPFVDQLSFIVPVSSIWSWDLYIDDLHLLRFAQAEEGACMITDIYTQVA